MRCHVSSEDLALQKMVSGALLFVGALTVVRAEWSFKDFLAGEWALERTRAGVLTRAYYTLNATAAGALEGLYHEDGANDEVTNQMRVRVLFDDELGLAGSFQLAKVKQPEKWDADGDDLPELVAQPEPRTVFQFEFAPQMDGRFWISESGWLGASGGKIQFVTTDDSFIISQFSRPKDAADGANDVTVSTWTALRKGAPPATAKNGAKGAERSMLQRWGPYLGTLLAYLVYKTAKP